MVVPPDSRYYVHASTHAARATQQLLQDTGNASDTRRRSDTRSPLLSRADVWILIGLAALVAGIGLLMAVVR